MMEYEILPNLTFVFYTQLVILKVRKTFKRPVNIEV